MRALRRLALALGLLATFLIGLVPAHAGPIVNPYAVAAPGAPPAGITLVGRKQYAEAGATGTVSVSLTDLTGGSASAPSVGDLIVIFWSAASAGVDLNPTAPSGYTELVNLWANDTYEANLIIWWKFATSGDLTSVTVPRGQHADHAMATHIKVYRGVNVTTPFDVTTTTATGTGGAQPNPPAITPVTAGARIVVAGVGAYSSMAALTNPGADLSDFVVSTQADTYDVATATGEKTNWVSGAFDPAAFGGGSTNGSSSRSSATLALRPQ